MFYHIDDSPWNDEPDPGATRSTNGLVVDTKLDYNNWQDYCTTLFPKAAIEQCAKRIRIGTSETLHWVNCERSEFMLVNSLSPDVKRLVSDCTTTREKWKKLVKRFSGKNKARAQKALKKLTNSSQGDSTLDTFISDATALVKECETAHGKDFIRFEELGKYMILKGLNNEFKTIKTIIVNENEEELSIRQLGEKLQNALDSIEQEDEMGLNLTPHQILQQKCTHSRNGRTCWDCHPELNPFKNSKCIDCHQMGHKNSRYKGCFKFNDKRNKPKVEQANFFSTDHDIYDPNEELDESDPTCHSAYTFDDEYSTFSLSNGNTGLILDTGASKTAIENKAALSNYQSCAITMKGAGNHRIVAPGTGIYKINNSLETEALHVPNIGANLLPVGQICDQDYITVFTKTKGTVYKSNTTLLKAILASTQHAILEAPRQPGRVYTYTPKASEIVMTFDKTITTKITLAHRRLGHLNIPAVKLLGKLQWVLT